MTTDPAVPTPRPLQRRLIRGGLSPRGSASTHVLLDLNGVFARGSIPSLQDSPAARIRQAFAEGYPR